MPEICYTTYLSAFYYRSNHPKNNVIQNWSHLKQRNARTQKIVILNGTRPTEQWTWFSYER